MCSALLYHIVHIIIFHLFKVFISLQSCFVRLVVALETVIDVIIDICIPFVLSDHMCTTEQEAYGVYNAITKLNYYLQGADITVK